MCCSGLGKLAITAQQAKLKQLRRVQLIKAQTYQKASLVNHRQAVDHLQEMRAAANKARHRQLEAERHQKEEVLEV